MSFERDLIGVVTVLLAAVPSPAAAHRSTEAYCINEPLEADTGRETFPLGSFVMKAKLVIDGSRYTLDAWNVMPDNSQTLEVHADGTFRPSEKTPIRFIDNFNNRGRGSFFATKATFHIELERVKASPEGLNIGRNYGSFDLKSEGCKWNQQ